MRAATIVNGSIAGMQLLTSATLKRETDSLFVVSNTERDRPNPPPCAGRRVNGADARLSPLLTGATPAGGHVLRVARRRNYTKAQAKLAHVKRVATCWKGHTKSAAPSTR